MAYRLLSSVEELQRNLPMLADTTISEDDLEANITDADRVVYDDLSTLVDWDELEALAATPRVVNRLSQYQAVLVTVMRQFHFADTMIGSGEGQNTIYTHYKGLYDALRKQIDAGGIRILDSGNEEVEPEVARRPGLGRII